MHRLRIFVPVGVPLALVAMAAAPAASQTDFYNLDKERPLRVEDAYATKRWAFELQVSPFTLTQQRDGALRFAPSIELKHGLLPGLEASLGLGTETLRWDSDSETSLGDLELSTLLNLWVEGPSLPAAGIRVTGHLPMSGDGAGALEAKGILTRSITGPIRGHLNAAVSLGEDREEDWWAGAALDYAFPFHHTLFLAEGWIAGAREGDPRFHTTVGLRFQLSPTFVLDAGAGRSWSGDPRQDWALTFGATHEFGVRALIPGGD